MNDLLFKDKNKSDTLEPKLKHQCKIMSFKVVINDKLFSLGLNIIISSLSIDCTLSSDLFESSAE